VARVIRIKRGGKFVAEYAGDFIAEVEDNVAFVQVRTGSNGPVNTYIDPSRNLKVGDFVEVLIDGSGRNDPEKTIGQVAALGAGSGTPVAVRSVIAKLIRERL
jgi:hypothetical protein